MRVQFDQLARTESGEVANFDAFWFAVGDLIDASAGAVNAGAFMAFAGVAPVEHEHSTIGPITEFHASEPRIASQEKGRPVASDVAGAPAFEDFLVHAAAMHVDREKATAIFGRPVIAKINHHADMRVTAAIRVRLAVARIPPAHCGVEVPMVRVLIDHRIHARVWINRMWPDEVRAGKVMPKMTVDGVDEK